MRRLPWILSIIAACGDSSATIDAPSIDARSSTTISARFGVLDTNAGTGPTYAPVADAYARLENAAGDFLEARTDADGNVAFDVDPVKGPYDVTLAKVGVTAVSVLGASGPLGDVDTLPLDYTHPVAVTGTIGGKIDERDTVLVDANYFNTVTSTTGDFTSVAWGPLPFPSPLVAQEIDANGRSVNIVESAATLRPPPTEHEDLVFPSPPRVPTDVMVNVSLPTSGIVTGTQLPVSVAQAAPCGAAVVKTGSEVMSAQVGCGKLAPPVDNIATLTVQTFPGPDFAPDVALVVLTSGKLESPKLTLTMPVAPLTDGATFSIPTVSAFSTSGSSLDTALVDTSGSGWSYAGIQVIASGNLLWNIYAPTTELAGRGLPHLPSALTVPMLGTGATQVMAVLHAVPSGTPGLPWQHDRRYIDTILMSGRQVLPTGR